MRSRVNKKSWNVNLALLLVCVVFASQSWALSFSPDTGNDSVDANPGDEVCADASGMCSLRAAIMETNALLGADIIKLRPDIYSLALVSTGEDAALNGDLDITDDLTIVAIEGSSEQAVTDGSNQSVTIVDGNKVDRVFHVIDSADSPRTDSAIRVNIDGITIRGGKVPFFGDGGGIRNERGELLLSNLTVAGNEANSGGGISNNSTSNSGIFGTVTITESRIINNKATLFEGGGIQNLNGRMVILNTEISGNSALMSIENTGFGGGIYNSSLLELIDVTVANNSSSTSGGGIANFPGGSGISGNVKLFISRSAITGNVVSNGVTDALGGGIFNGGGEFASVPALLTLVNSTVSGNEALSRDDSGRVFDCTDGEGGIALNPPCVFPMRAVSNFGGGVYNGTGGSLVARNATIADNISGHGAGVFQQTGSGIGTSALKHTILADNTIERSSGRGNAGVENCADDGAKLLSAGYNLDSGSSCGLSADGDLSSVAPVLATLSIEAGSLTATHALNEGSPAIDAGDPNGCVDEDGDTLKFDQRGFSRHSFDRHPQQPSPVGDPVCDIGAYEHGSIGPSTLQFTAAVFQGKEGAGQVQITVSRSKNSEGTVSVSYGILALAENTAFRSRDYQLNPGSLEWRDGDTSSKSFLVTLLDDSEKEGNESTLLRLFNALPEGSAVLGGNDTARLEIIDDDGPPSPNTFPGSPSSGATANVGGSGGGGMLSLWALLAFALVCFLRASNYGQYVVLRLVNKKPVFS